MTQDALARIEAARVRTQERLDNGRPAADRNRLGQFATPQALASDIARLVLRHAPTQNGGIDFADPAFGTGSFYSALLATVPRKNVRSAMGIEIDPSIVAETRSLWAGADLQVLLGDFTDPRVLEGTRVRPNLVLTNPPYVRHHHIAREEKLRLQELVSRRMGLRVNGLAGLYVYYLLLATSWMQDDGTAAWLIPSEFMEVNYGEVLRHFLSKSVTLLRVHRFDPADVQFQDALVSSAVVVFRKESPPKTAEATFSFGGSLDKPRVVQQVPIASLHSETKWTRFTRVTPTEGGTGCEAEVVLGDLFKVQRGIATGSNEFFVLSREDARGLGLPKKFLRPILPSPRALKMSIIGRDRDGFPSLPDQRVLLDCPEPEVEVRRRYPRLWAYLATAKEKGVLNRYLVAKRMPWYRQESRPPAPFLCTYMGRGTRRGGPFRFILNHSDATAANVYLLLYPRPPFAALLAEDSKAREEVYKGLCEIESESFHNQGRVYGGGLHKVEPKELARVTARPIIRSCKRLKSLIGCHRDGGRLGPNK